LTKEIIKMAEIMETPKVNYPASSAPRVFEKIIPILISKISPFTLFEVSFPIGLLPKLASSLKSFSYNEGIDVFLFGHLPNLTQMAIPLSKNDLKEYLNKIREFVTLLSKFNGRIIRFSSYGFKSKLNLTSTLFSEKSLEIFHKIKRVFDPKMILNDFVE